MGKKVSPAFALIVILVAVGIAALWFMYSYRADQTRLAEERRISQQLLQETRRSRRPYRPGEGAGEAPQPPGAEQGQVGERGVTAQEP